MLPMVIPRLLAAMPRSAPVAAAWIGPLNQAMIAFDITTDARIAAFLAQCAHESAELTQLRENMNYSAKRLREIFPRHFPDDATAERYGGRPVEIANRVYADRFGNGPEASGDGWTYRAAGPLGLTFKNQFRDCSIAICRDADTLLLNPDLLEDPEFGAASAAWYWESRGLNELADAGDFEGITRKINGGLNGLADRVAHWRRAIQALA